MNPVTEFCSYVFMGNFSPVDRDEFKKHNQNGESEASLFKRFRPGHRAEVFIWENSHLGYRDLGRKHRYFYKEKSGKARSQKPSQPGQPGSYEEALNLQEFGGFY